MYDRDLFIIRDHSEIFPGGAGGVRGTSHWIFDGTTWTELPSHAPLSCIACDEEGGLYYGSPRVIIKHNEWRYDGTGTYGPVTVIERPPNIPPDDPENDPTDPPPDYTALQESHTFTIQIGRNRIHIHGFYGQHELSTVDVVHPDWPNYEIADRNNSRTGQALDGDLWASWTFSKDGTIRVPHTQPHLPYTPISETLYRIVRRQYIGRDTSEWYETTFKDSLDRTVLWPKWMTSFFPPDWAHGMENFYPWATYFGTTGGLMRDGFYTTSFCSDIAIADCDCDCSCKTIGY